MSAFPIFFSRRFYLLACSCELDFRPRLWTRFKRSAGLRGPCPWRPGSCRYIGNYNTHNPMRSLAEAGQHIFVLSSSYLNVVLLRHEFLEVVLVVAMETGVVVVLLIAFWSHGGTWRASAVCWCVLRRVYISLFFFFFAPDDIYTQKLI